MRLARTQKQLPLSIVLIPLALPHAPLALEVRAAFQDAGLQIPVSDYPAGMGGADITLDQMGQVYAELSSALRVRMTVPLSILVSKSKGL